MENNQKKRSLLRYKAFATGLFLLMMVVFALMSYLESRNQAHWIGYIRAFSEAAMVGALADWFAVTALFHYPLGIRIPHTNIIANSKQRIGNNLGSFVVENFLSAENIRPFIEKMRISVYASEWLKKDKNKHFLANEIITWLSSAFEQFKDEDAIRFISSKVDEMTNQINFSKIVSNGIFYLLERREQDKIITFISAKIKDYILENQDMIQQRVSAKSFVFIPRFIDRKIGEKVISGLVEYYAEIENNPEHPLRKEISEGISKFAAELRTNDKWEPDMKRIKDSFLRKDKIDEYAMDIWGGIKNSLAKDLNKENSSLKSYIFESISKMTDRLNSNPEIQDKIDKWVRLNAYQFILRNSYKVGEIISNTVGNWKDEEITKKLEVEVGKDLQFIRVNGTIVGGLVGLIIYTIVHFVIR